MNDHFPEELVASGQVAVPDADLEEAALELVGRHLGVDHGLLPDGAATARHAAAAALGL